MLSRCRASAEGTPWTAARAPQRPASPLHGRQPPARAPDGPAIAMVRSSALLSLVHATIMQPAVPLPLHLRALYSSTTLCDESILGIAM